MDILQSIGLIVAGVAAILIGSFVARSAFAALEETPKGFVETANGLLKMGESDHLAAISAVGLIAGQEIMIVAVPVISVSTIIWGVYTVISQTMHLWKMIIV